MTAAMVVTFDSANSRVSLVGSGLNAATASAVIYRWENGEVKSVPRANLVRQAIGAVTAFTVYDYTFAEGVANDYQLMTYNSSGTLLDTVTGSATVTPSNGGATWFKSVYRPYLNRVITMVDYSESDFTARGTVFDVLGQNNSVAVTDVRSGRAITLTLVCANDAERHAVETFVSFGDIVFLQTPNASVVDSMFAYVGAVKISRRGEKASTYRYADIDLVQVSEPASGIVGYSATWAGIVSAFATWTALEAALATWAAVNAYIASPTDEIIG